jgi:hypothetical protein
VIQFFVIRFFVIRFFVTLRLRLSGPPDDWRGASRRRERLAIQNDRKPLSIIYRS